MQNWLKKRLGEPSTVLGVGALVSGVGQMIGGEAGASIGSIASGVANSFATGDNAGGLMLAITGILGLFMKEKGRG